MHNDRRHAGRTVVLRIEAAERLFLLASMARRMGTGDFRIAVEAVFLLRFARRVVLADVI